MRGRFKEVMRARLMRPRAAPRAYWAARSRIGVASPGSTAVVRDGSRELRGRRGVCFAQSVERRRAGDPLRRLVSRTLNGGSLQAGS
jgi:hypothetical protein